MVADLYVPVSADKMSHENGVHEQHSAPGEGVVLEKMNGVPASGSEIAVPNGNAETVATLEDDGIIYSSTIAVPDRPTAHAESNGLTASKVGDNCQVSLLACAPINSHSGVKT